MTTNIRPLPARPEQLTLFKSSVPERFRIDDATRRRGIRYIAEIRTRLEARYPTKPEALFPESQHSVRGSRPAGRAA